MTESPKINLSKFTTLTLTQRSNKMNPYFGSKRKGRKSNSSLLNPETSYNFKSIQQTNLPKIESSKKKLKKGSFLQSWLDKALDSDDPQNQNNKKDEVDSGMFKTLHKFELDKRYLQSQNIPSEVIQKMYNNLYIYTHGINSIFSETIKWVHQNKNFDLLNNFWRAFTKLLEGCTSYQTVYQQIQKKHLSTIVNLKHNIQRREQNYSQERKELEQTIHKLNKQLQDKQHRFDLLNNEFKVLQSTLQLTDDAFNEEVNLRLKFEQKINAVYTSYDELSEKYKKIVEEMGLKNQFTVTQQSKQIGLRNQLFAQKVKVEELQHLLKIATEKVHERETEILIKKQELEDLKETYFGKINKDEQSENVMQEQISKVKALQAKISEYENVIKGKNTTINEHEEFIKKLQTKIEELRKFNNQIFDKFVSAGKEITNLESVIIVNEQKINQLNGKLVSKGENLCDSERELTHVKNERDNLQKDLQISVKDLNDKSVVLSKNNEVIAQLKAIKDKYQRINEIVNLQKNNLEKLANESTTQLSLNEEEMEGLKLLLQTRNKTLIQMQKQFDQERETTKIKLTALTKQISKKESVILEYQKAVQKSEDELIKKKGEIKDITDRAALLESQKIKTEIDLSGKIKSYSDLEGEYNKISEKFRKLNEKIQVELKAKDELKQKLKSMEYVLTTKNSEDHIEIQHLKNLIQEYKKLLIEKSQYIHPMIYEEVEGQAKRSVQKQKIAIKEHATMKKQNSVLKEDSKLKSDQNQNYKKQIEKQKKIVTDEKQKIEKLQKKISENNKKLDSQIKKVSDFKEKLLEKEEQIKDQKSQVTNLKLQNIELERTVEEKNEGIDMLTEEMTKMTKRKTSEAKSSRLESRQRLVMIEEIGIQTEEMKKSSQSNRSKKTEKPVEKQMQDAECQTQFEQEEQKIEEETKKERTAQQKVEKKDFKKALKLTFMRR